MKGERPVVFALTLALVVWKLAPLLSGLIFLIMGIYNFYHGSKVDAIYFMSSACVCLLLRDTK